MVWLMIFIEEVILAIYQYYVNKLEKLSDQCEVYLKAKDYEKFDRLNDAFDKTNYKADKWRIRFTKVSEYANKKLLEDGAQ